MPSISLGKRVNVRGEHGTVRFVGLTQFAPGEWVGVELDSPKGRNNGCVQGIEYFQCDKPGMYGVFVRSELLEEAASMMKDSSVTPDVKLVVSKLQSKLRLAKEEISKTKEIVVNLELQIKTEQTHRDEVEALLEQSTVDVEYFRERNTELTEVLESLREKYDLLSTDFSIINEELEIHKELEKAVTSQNLSEPVSVDDYHTLVLHSKKLELALSSLKSVLEEAESSKSQTLKLLSEKSMEYAELEKSNELLHQKLADSESAVRQLQEQLEASAESSSVIEHLTSENERLQAEIAELSQSVSELTELHEMDKTIEEDNILAQRELQKLVFDLKGEIKDHKKQLGQLQSANNALLKESGDFKRGILNGNAPKKDHDYENLILELKKIKARDSMLAFGNSLLDASLDSISGLPNELVPEKYQGQIRTIVALSKCLASSSVVLSHITTLPSSGDNYEAQIIFRCAVSSINFLEVVAEHVHSLSKGKVNSFTDKVSQLTADFSKVFSQFEPSDLYTLDYSPAKQLIAWTRELSQTIELSNVARAELWWSCARHDVAMGLEISKQIRDTYITEDFHFESVNNEIIQFISKSESLLAQLDERLKILKENRVQDLGEVPAATQVEFVCPRMNTLLKDLEMQIGIDENELLEKLSGTYHSTTFQDFFIVYESELKQRLVFKENSRLSIYQILSDENQDGAQNTVKAVCALENQLLEKTQTIQNLQLQIELLENNMMGAISGKDAQLNETKESLMKVRVELALLKQQSEDLSSANKKLQAQLDNMHSVDNALLFTQVPAFESLKAMREYTTNMALAEEISLLQGMVGKRNTPISDDDWLKKSLIPRNSQRRHDTSFAILQAAHSKRKEAYTIAHAIIKSSKVG